MPPDFSIRQIPSLYEEIQSLGREEPLEIDVGNIETFDSSGVAFLNYLKKNFSNLAILNLHGDLAKVLELFPPGTSSKEIPSPKPSFNSFLEGFSRRLTKFRDRFHFFFVLLADEIFHSFQYILKRRGVYPGEIMNQLFYMGYNSFPIVSVISLLVGITISITSAEQLRNFGADIYLADIVGFGMVRELVPLMTGIILAGKIGASITAEISSMKVLEEVDALKTMGLIPEKFLMVPRLIAITLAVPLLVAVANIIGIFGGILVAQFASGITPDMFLREMFTVVGLSDFFIGLFKTVVFGWIIVVSSGYKGFSVERGAVGVGIATTESVVLSISLIIVVDCAFALVLY